MFCPKCGEEVSESIKFCPKCGESLKDDISSSFTSVSSLNIGEKQFWKGWSTRRKIVSVIVACCVGLLIIGAIGSFMAPDQNTSYTSNSMEDSSSVSSDSSSSSNYDDMDTHSHYEGDEGTADTHGKVYSDGSVEAHTTGSTKYGDYQIDSYMDSDGNVHGKVKTGGHTYYT